MRRLIHLLCLLPFLASLAPVPQLQAQNITPENILQRAGITMKIGETVPQDIVFQNEAGEDVTLGSFLGKKPVFLIPVYYECPMLCSLILNGFLKALNAMRFAAGEEFDVITFSFDPEETPSLARQKKKNYMAGYHHASPTGDGWHFLTGSEASIKTLTEAIGYRYEYDPETDEFGHPSVLLMLSPEGQITHYFSGVEFSARDFRLAVVEASDGKVGNIQDLFLLLCYHYDPMKGRYGLAITTALRVAGVLTILILALAIFGMLKQERKKTAVR